MHELGRSNYSLGFLLVKCQVHGPHVYVFFHALTGDGKITNWYVKKINYLKSMSCVVNKFSGTSCLFGNKQETQFQMKKKIITFADISGIWNIFFRL